LVPHFELLSLLRLRELRVVFSFSFFILLFDAEDEDRTMAPVLPFLLSLLPLSQSSFPSFPSSHSSSPLPARLPPPSSSPVSVEGLDDWIYKQREEAARRAFANIGECVSFFFILFSLAGKHAHLAHLALFLLSLR